MEHLIKMDDENGGVPPILGNLHFEMWISLLSRFRGVGLHNGSTTRSLRYAERLELAFIDHSRGRFVDASLGAVLDGIS